MVNNDIEDRSSLFCEDESEGSERRVRSVRKHERSGDTNELQFQGEQFCHHDE